MLASPGITNDSSLLSVCTCTDWIIIAVIVRMCEVNDTLAPLCVGYGSSVWSCQVLLSVDRSKETYEACRQWVLCARYELCLKILYYEQMRTWGGGGGGGGGRGSMPLQYFLNLRIVVLATELNRGK